MNNLSGVLVDSYRQQLESGFPFFRMMLRDEVDASINYFIGSGNITFSELRNIYEGMYEVLAALINKHPMKVAKSVDDKLKLARGKRGSDFDVMHHELIFSTSKVLIHLLTETSLILSLNSNEH